MLRLLIPFLIGIIVYSLAAEFHVLSNIILSLCIVGFIINEFRGNLLRRQITGGLLLFLSFIAFGILHTHLRNPLNHKNHYSYQPNAQLYTGTIEDIAEKERFTRVVLKVDQILDTAGHKNSVRGKMMTYLYDVPENINISPGMRLICQGFPGKPPAPSIPDAFDYRDYLVKQNIHDIMFLKEGRYQLLPAEKISLRTHASRLRKFLVNIISETTKGGEAASVISAMVLGERSELSSDTREVFTNTGAIHVLAVSGLHVGIVFLFLQFLLTKIQILNKRFRLVKLVLILMGIWSYAFITGLAPSVMRSGIMMTLFAIGMNFQRKSKSINTLAASAFVMLVINPSLIYQIGFQFSYLAVLGIILFQRSIENLFFIRYRIPAFLWKLISVSLAAQVTVSPLSIYYFNQFPLSFLISSAIVVLLAYVILVSVLTGLILYPFLNIVGEYIIQIAEWIVDLELLCLNWLNAFPSLLLDELWIPPFVIICIYLLLLVLANIHSISTKWSRWSIMITCSLGFFGMIWQKGMNKTKSEVYVCSDERIPFVLWQRGNTSGINSADSLHFSEILDHAMKWRSRNDINDLQPPPLWFDNYNKQSNKILTIDDERFIFIQERLILDDSIDVEYAVLQNNAWIEKLEFNKLRGLKQVIMAAGNKWSYQNYWRYHCKRHEIAFHNLSTDGYVHLISN